ncbi:lysis protein [Escherichia phage BZ13]|uniref:Lysis protein n=1 Tax=Escherichia phage BZ13 TaxID=329853 RepID=C8YJH2_BPBZ1|nr:lysis protein [Escherichia phage BZ13]
MGQKAIKHKENLCSDSQRSKRLYVWIALAIVLSDFTSIFSHWIWGLLILILQTLMDLPTFVTNV